MNKLYLLINSDSYLVELNLLDIEFNIDVCYQDNLNSGEFNIYSNNIEYSKYKYSLYSIKFKLNNNILDLDKYIEKYQIDRESIKICSNNIFELYEDYLNFINNSLLNNNFKSSLLCMFTQLTCNLACKYCSMSSNHIHDTRIPSYEVSRHIFLKLKSIVESCKYAENNTMRYRIMGGETFLHPNIYKYVYTNMNEISSVRKNNILYLYSNILVNLNSIIENVRNAVNDGYTVIFIASVDSFDTRFSNRFSNLDEIRMFKQNMCILRDKFKSMNNVIFTVSVLSTNNFNDICKTFNLLLKYDIRNIKFSFDEFKISDKETRKKLYIIKKLIRSKYNRKFNTSKLLVDDFFVNNFNIVENGRLIGSVRTVNRLGYNIHKLYKYHSILRKFFKKEAVFY